MNRIKKKEIQKIDITDKEITDKEIRDKKIVQKEGGIDSKSIIIKSLREKYILVIMLLFVSIGHLLATLMPSLILKRIIDNNLYPKNYQGLDLLVGIYFLLVMSSGLLKFTQSYLVAINGQRIIRKLRESLSRKASKLPFTYFTRFSTSSILSHFNSDVEAVNDVISEGIVGLIFDAVRIVATVYFMAILNIKLGIASIFLLPIIYLLSSFFRIRMNRAQKESLNELEEVNHHIGESVENAVMIKMLKRENFMERRYKKELVGHYRVLKRVNLYDSIYSPIIQILRASVIVLVVMLASSKGVVFITAGTLAAAVDLIMQLFDPIESIGMQLQALQKGGAAIERIDLFLKEDEDSKKDLNLSSEAIFLNDEGIKFKNVTFAYDKETVLENIDLEIDKGKIVTFIGRTGAGKSTIFKLITGLYSPLKGSITIGGYDADSIPNNIKRQVFAYVVQDFHLTGKNLIEEITLGDSKITRHEAINAIDLVGLSNLYKELDNGYDTILDEKKLSSGQKQLLQIARSLASGGKIILLDEMNSKLDSLTEEKIVKLINSLKKDHIIINISHRLSSLLESDEIYEVKDKKIIKKK